MQKELNIVIPEGFEIDKEKSTFEKIIFKKKTNKYPKTWEEFCKEKPVSGIEYFINHNSVVLEYGDSEDRDEADKNLCKTKEEAEAFLTLIQLKRLWHEYVEGFESDYFGYSIYLIDISGAPVGNGWFIDETNECSIFSFPSIELAQKFLDNFKELFKKIEPLFYN